MVRDRKVATGLQRVAEGRCHEVFEGRLGLLCNQASVDGEIRHAKEIFASIFPGRLTALFSPQHGFFADKQDNMVESDDILDPTLGIPVFSLYGESRSPLPHQLELIDTLVVDLQDVGCRVYTFVWTMLLAMEACSRAGKRMVVLDRPNPIGGAVEGNLLRPQLTSFVGLHPLPMRHGMTMGELALLFRWERKLDLDLQIVTMEGWRRDLYFADTGLPWIWPSPNMPHMETALVYPGTVLLEGTNVSEGRGTTRPFETFGAPWMDPRQLAQVLHEMEADHGVILREQWFEPTFHKWAGQTCRGLQIHVVDNHLFRPYRLGLALLAAMARLYPDTFSWRPPPYEYEYERLPMDLLIGDTEIRRAVGSGRDPRELEPLWEEELSRFMERRKPFLLYP